MFPFLKYCKVYANTFFYSISGIFFIGITASAEESDNITNSCVTSEYSIKYQYRAKKACECTIQRTFKEEDKIDPGYYIE
jgi:hypothetical protein